MLLVGNFCSHPSAHSQRNYFAHTMGLGSSVNRIVNMEGPIAKFVQEAIAKDKVVIFSKTYCPYCTMAKEVRNCEIYYVSHIFIIFMLLIFVTF
jgi:hypothetical protein